MKIPIVTHCKYLGVIVSEHNSDNDLKRQMRKFYANANMLIRKFSKSSINVNVVLNLYGVYSTVDMRCIEELLKCPLQI